jgi:hypothetical protein
MNPPAGRIQLGDRVTLPDGHAGRVVGERLVVSNGAWRYRVELDGGVAVERYDYELTKIAA